MRQKIIDDLRILIIKHQNRIPKGSLQIFIHVYHTEADLLNRNHKDHFWSDDPKNQLVLS